jgi:F-type H+-transporting ATPase subunit gamma
MASTRDIRNRIRGVKNTAKITRAMQLVAASKMRRAQNRALEGRPYAEQLCHMLAALNDRVKDFKHPYLEERTQKTRGVLIISTDRGLCGALNANLFREVAKLDRHATAFVTVGRKARQFITRTQRKLLADFPISEDAEFRELRPVVEFMISQFLEGKIDTFEVLYTRFRNTLIQEPIVAPLLPFVDFQQEIERVAKEAGRPIVKDDREILFEPHPEPILRALLDVFIKRQVYQLLIDARASEQSARMVAMKAATDNAKKLTDSLTLQYNKARQAGITQEILEITAAALHS